MKHFKDRWALQDLISRISKEVPSDQQVKVLADLLVNQSEFTNGNAATYAGVALRYRQANSAECIAANGSKLAANWLGMDQSGAVGGYLDSTSYKWGFRQDLTFEYRKESYRGYISPFGGGGSSNSSNGFAGVWAPSDSPGDELEVVTIDASNFLGKLSIKWLDKAMQMLRSCQIDGRNFARQ
jgi:hypothetical protein